MEKIKDSELILNADGSIFHLHLKPENIGDTILLLGDQGRVAEVSKYFDEITFKVQNREFCTHTGTLRGKKITALSTGIGTDNIDIVINELDALVNIDFETRTINQEKKSLSIIRIGTCGSLQGEIPVDSFIAGTHGLGIDNLLNYYLLEPNEEEGLLLQQFVTQTQLNSQYSRPYIATASMALLKHFVTDFYTGITVTCPGFYGPQGRVLRLGLRQPDLIDALTHFSYGQHRIVNFEMESSAIYGLGKLLGHQCLSLNAVVANRITKTFSKDGTAAAENLIVKALGIIGNI